MPKVHCLFARPGVVERMVLDDPDLRRGVYRLGRVDGLKMRDAGALTVVRLDDPDGRAPTWDDDALFAPIFARYGWLRGELPPRPLVYRLQRFAGRHDVELAWFHWFERGDDLYADAAITFGRERRVYVRETGLMAEAASAACFEIRNAVHETAWSGSPYRAAMDAIGIESTTQYFPPEDTSRFDWEAHRVALVDGTPHALVATMDPVDASLCHVEIHGERATPAVRYRFVRDRYRHRGWWLGEVGLAPETIARAVEIARRDTTRELSAAQVAEAIDLPVALDAELAGATAALVALPDAIARFAIRWLAIGCAGGDDPAIADWIASHANELVAAPWAEVVARAHGNGVRSALAFLVERCARLDVELAIDPSQVPSYERVGELPWGIPATHAWWCSSLST